MSEGPIDIRRLLPDEAAMYREIRLEGLTECPDAFSSTLESERARPLAAFAQRLTDSAIFGAFRAEQLLGVAGFSIQDGEKHAHKGLLWGMYVRPQARGTGVGRALIIAVIEHARRRVELIQLRVVNENLAARRLYESLGFVEYGLERHAAKYRGRYHDDVLMAAALPLGAEAEASRKTMEAAPA